MSKRVRLQGEKNAGGRIVIVVTKAGIVVQYQVKRRRSWWIPWKSWAVKLATKPHTRLADVEKDIAVMLSPMWSNPTVVTLTRAERRRVAKAYARGATKALA